MNGKTLKLPVDLIPRNDPKGDLKLDFQKSSCWTVPAEKISDEDYLYLKEFIEGGAILLNVRIHMK